LAAALEFFEEALGEAFAGFGLDVLRDGCEQA
jgi:hypothetical protein